MKKYLIALVGVGAITALTLPGRNAAQVATSVGNAFLSNPLATVIKG